jgi:hypothetical protein
MDDEAFNLSIRRFLKQFGVTAQRQIERAVADAIASGQLSGEGKVMATATLRLPSLGIETVVEDEILLG